MKGVRLTREGARFLILLAIIAFAAYNTRNNLLYLMLSVGLGVAFASLVAGYLALARLTVVGSETPDLYAGQPFRETLSLSNHSRWLDAFGIEIADGTAPIPLVPRGGKALGKRTRLYRRRGVYEGEPVETSTRFPYGLFRFRRAIDSSRTLVVFPRVRPVDASWLAYDRQIGDSQALRRGVGEEFYRLRSYVPGDHVHLVHWKSSAKQGELMVREFGDDGDPRYCLTFAQSLPSGRDSSEFEILVSAVASVATHFTRQGIAFRFLSATLDLPPRCSDTHLRDVLTHLATVAPTDELDRWEAEVRAAVARGETVVAISIDGERELVAGPELYRVTPQELFV
jgi:uncharacterized protein (DUF58 family)